VAPTARIAVGTRTVDPARTFSAVAEGTAFWYVNSNGLVEIAVNRGRASDALGLAVGTPVAVLSPSG
jgi:S-adenosylmethionine hydrolase